MVAFDATTLLLLFFPTARPPKKPDGTPLIDRIKERIDYLVKCIEKEKDKIVIPTPALSEMLVHAGNARADYIEIINRSSCFRVAAFDDRSAIEAAMMTRMAKLAGDKRGGSPDNWPKVKFDRQIVAIAKVEEVSAIYSDDSDIKSIAKGLGIPVVSVATLPLDPEQAQPNLFHKDDK